VTARFELGAAASLGRLVHSGASVIRGEGEAAAIGALGVKGGKLSLVHGNAKVLGQLPGKLSRIFRLILLDC